MIQQTNYKRLGNSNQDMSGCAVLVIILGALFLVCVGFGIWHKMHM